MSFFPVPSDRYFRTTKRNATASTRLGSKINSVEELAAAAEIKRAVFSKGWGLLPAVVVMNMPASVVHGAIKRGLIFAYKGAKK